MRGRTTGHLDVDVSGHGSMGAGGDIVDSQIINVFGDALPLAEAALDYSPVTAAAVSCFTAREWLVERVEGLLAPGGPAGAGGYVLVQAKAGMGKTAVAAWLAHRWGCASHFSRVTRGRVARVALQSLAAQLITRYDLDRDRFAPGGMLAGWVGDPARFGAVLSAAADRASARGTVVRIVVDGLDEAEVVDGDFPFGLPVPQALAPGVQIVATCRDGMPASRVPAGDRCHTVVIPADSGDNRSDVDRYLRERLTGSPAGRLSAAGVTVDAAIDLLAERSGGVWVYLHYVLERIRADPAFTAGDLAGLPPGLEGYYRRELTGRWDTAEFHDEDLMVLAALAAARQPLTRTQLATLTALPAHLVRRLCEGRYRPFVQTYAQGGQVGYELYHESLREFLHGRGRGGESAGTTAAVDEPEACDLAAAVTRAHDAISDHYLAMFGGLGDGLPVLSGDPAVAGIDDRYPVRHLVAHLVATGRLSDLATLLSRRDAPGGELGGVWARAHEGAGAADGYLTDVHRTRALAESRTNDHLARHQSAPTLAVESLCAALQAQVVATSNNLPPQLLGALVRTGLWEVGRGLSHAYRLLEPEERAAALVALAPHVIDPVVADAVRRRALAAACSIRDEKRRAPVLGVVAACLTEPSHLDEAITAARAMTDPEPRTLALATTAGRLPDPDRGPVIREVLEATSAIVAQPVRARVLVAVAEVLTDPADLSQALAVALDLTSEEDRGPALAAVADRLSDPRQLDQALHAARFIGDPRFRAAALSAVGGRLSGVERDRVLTQALTAARAVPFYDGSPFTLSADSTEVSDFVPWMTGFPELGLPRACRRAHALSVVAQRLSEPDRSHVLREALHESERIVIDTERARALCEVAARLTDPAQLGYALDAALAFTDGGSRSDVLCALAARLNDPVQLGRAVDAAVTITYAYSRSRALDALAAHLNAPAHLHAALAATHSSPSVSLRIEAFSALAAQLPGAERHGLLTQALSAVATVSDDYLRGWTLCTMVSRLNDPDHLTQAFTLARALTLDSMRAKALLAIAVQQRDPALWAEAVSAACSISYEGARADALVAAAGHLSDRGHPGSLSQAVTTARALSYPHQKAQVLRALAAGLNDPERGALLKEALEAARDAELVPALSDRLNSLVARFDGADLDGFLSEVLDGHWSPLNSRTEGRVLGAVAARLRDPAELDWALAQARAFTDGQLRAEALSGLASALSEPDRGVLVAEAFEAVATITEDESRADALCAVIVRLDDRPGDHDRLTTAMAQARAISSVYDRARVLDALTERTTDLSLQADALTSQLPTPGYASWVIRNVFRQTAHRRPAASPQERLDLLRRVYHAPLTTSQLISAITASAELIAVFGSPTLAAHIELVWSVPDLPTTRHG